MSDSEKNNEYNYYKYIKTPNEMGIKVGSSLDNVSDGIAGIFKYIKVLVEGKSGASKTGEPLGNKFFIETTEKCIDQDTKTEKTRSLYFDNIPTGNFGIIKDTGENFSEFRGLIPGAIENMMTLGKIDFFSIFTQSTQHPCKLVKLKTVDIDNKIGEDEAYIIVDDIKQISPCNFPSKQNPETKDTCKRDGFMLQNYMKDEEINNANLYENYYKLDDDNSDSDSNSNSDSDSDTDNVDDIKNYNYNNKKKNKKNNNVKLKMPDDLFLQILFYSLGALSVYIALKLLANMYKKRD